MVTRRGLVSCGDKPLLHRSLAASPGWRTERWAMTGLDAVSRASYLSKENLFLNRLGPASEPPWPRPRRCPPGIADQGRLARNAPQHHRYGIIPRLGTHEHRLRSTTAPPRTGHARHPGRDRSAATTNQRGVPRNPQRPRWPPDRGDRPGRAVPGDRRRPISPAGQPVRRATGPRPDRQHRITALRRKFRRPVRTAPDRAYNETCASIASFQWSWRLLATGGSKYADLMERTRYNGFAAATSTDGDRFFYVNPLQRRENLC